MSQRPRTADDAEPQPAATTGRSAWAVLQWGLAGAVVTYLAHPPVGWSLLGWIGPAAWIAMIAWPELPGRRPYRALWIAGLVYWLLTIAWLRLPSPYNWGALAFVTSYLGLYLPVFVGLSRVAVHRLRLPLLLAAPVVWTGLELARAHLLTGFLMGSLAETQYRWPQLIQFATIGGEYAVTFVMLLFASLVVLAVPAAASNSQQAGPDEAPASPRRNGRAVIRHAWRMACPAVLLATVFLYGEWATRSVFQLDSNAPQIARIALIQSDMLADWKGTRQRDEDVMLQQADLSRNAVRENGEPLDLIVWPETMFRMPLNQRGDGYQPPAGLFQDLFGASAAEVFASTPNYLAAMVTELQAAVLVGVDRRVWRDPVDGEPPLFADGPAVAVDSFNSSVMVDRTGRIVGTYDKMHLLPFGEYVPLVRWIPLLRKITPITGGAVAGAGPVALPLPLASDPQRVVRYAPNICYETAVPHLIRRQVAELHDRGEAPDVLVNLTNDAWYWGSAELDMHLAAAVLRAVETRTPVVIAANRGLSAHISAEGRIVGVTPRDTAATLIADVRLPRYGPGLPTLYVRYGDWLPGACLLCCMVFAIVGWRERRAAKRVAVA